MPVRPLECPPAGSLPDPKGCDSAQAINVCNTVELAEDIAAAISGSATTPKRDVEHDWMGGCVGGVSTPTRFITQYNENDGTVLGSSQQWLVSGAWVGTAPVGWVLGDCPALAKRDVESAVIQGCASGVNVPSRFVSQYNADTGALVSEVQQYLVAGSWTTVAPAGWSIGACPSAFKVDSEMVMYDGCAAGASVPTRFVTRTNEDTGAVITDEQQYLVSGAWTTTQPAGWVLGSCPSLPKSVKVHLENITVTTTLASIVATLGTTTVTSVSVMQHVGNGGSVTGTSGTGIHLQQDASWSVSTDNNIDTLVGSGLTFIPGASGEQHLTVIYL